MRNVRSTCASMRVDATAHLAEIFPGHHVVLSEWQLFPNLEE